MDNNFNSQSDNSSDWKANSRQKNKSRTGRKSKLSVLTIVLLVTAIASIIANIVLPDLIDCYIYQLNSEQKRYKYLLQKAKESEIYAPNIYLMQASDIL